VLSWAVKVNDRYLFLSLLSVDTVLSFNKAVLNKEILNLDREGTSSIVLLDKTDKSISQFHAIFSSAKLQHNHWATYYESEHHKSSANFTSILSLYPVLVK
jgi:hypothetical protein